MHKYIVLAKKTEYGWVKIEADNQSQAKRKAHLIGNFTWDDSTLEITSVEKTIN